jgi:hypothetical protein
MNYHMAMVHYKRGEVEEARKRLEVALEEDTAFYGREDAEKVLADIRAGG